MSGITLPVGRHVFNPRREEVLLVQRLLNKHRPRPLLPIAEDGVVGPETCGAIDDFQRRVLKMERPDGRVDPGGRTFLALAGEGTALPRVSGIAFQTFWDNYSSESPCKDPKTGKPPPGYDNQCSMRLGYAMEKSGVSFASYHGGRCPFGSKHGGMVASAQGLANWLKTRPFRGCPTYEKYTGQDVFEKIKGRTGIIFFANYWQRDSDKGDARTGDHIDLWNGSHLTATSSWFRVHLGVSLDGVWSDFRRATEVLFWPIG
jgi:hypothetical protein